ncbi:hypothetical protein [Sinanaerobacter sp. ZZT-01]|nr:hypothetical protein [Sinanaerobacter sp. ZZT-01]WRR92461.1 hypothetical protein U5921_10380 [Sinanaerobacter sp. ZZT-01]
MNVIELALKTVQRAVRHFKIATTKGNVRYGLKVGSVMKCF